MVWAYLKVFEHIARPKGPLFSASRNTPIGLFRSAHILRMDIPFSKDELNEAQKLVVRENNLEEAYMRPMCFLGSEGNGL